MNAEDVDLRVRMELDLLRDVHQAYLVSAQNTLERIVKRAERAGAISLGLLTAYSGLLALGSESMGTGDWIFPALWLAISAVLYGAYLSMVEARATRSRPLVLADTEAARTERLRLFVNWINATALRGAWALQLGSLSQVAGLVSAALVLVGRGGWQWQATLLGVGLMVATPLGRRK